MRGGRGNNGQLKQIAAKCELDIPKISSSRRPVGHARALSAPPVGTGRRQLLCCELFYRPKAPANCNRDV